MNTDILQLHWEEMKGDLKQWWGKLTDNDLSFIDGRVNKLVECLQERYSWTKEQATQEVNRCLNELHRNFNPSQEGEEEPLFEDEQEYKYDPTTSDSDDEEDLQSHF